MFSSLFRRIVRAHIFIFSCDPVFFFSIFSAFTDNLILIMQNQKQAEYSDYSYSI